MCKEASVANLIYQNKKNLETINIPSLSNAKSTSFTEKFIISKEALFSICNPSSITLGSCKYWRSSKHKIYHIQWSCVHENKRSTYYWQNMSRDHKYLSSYNSVKFAERWEGKEQSIGPKGDSLTLTCNSSNKFNPMNCYQWKLTEAVHSKGNQM